MLGLYIHIPFCIQKCSYCDFVSLPGCAWEEDYIRALLKEIRLAGRLYKERVNTVFLGGGTPSLIKAENIVKIMNAVRGNFTVTEDAEVTVECNPSSMTVHKLRVYREVGVNRLSIGLQAEQGALLARLGRQHTAEQFDVSFEAARAAGFGNINVDVIYAIPGQTTDDWRETLFHVLYRHPEHISAYALHIETGTPMGQMLAAGAITPVDEDTDAEMYRLAQDILAEKGYENYEISNFALPGRECAHNLKYWNLRNYLGLGVAAHSCILRLRFSNTTDVERYIRQVQQNGLRYETWEMIGDDERKKEYLMLKLRLKKGFLLSEYKSLFEEDFLTAHGQQLEQTQQYGLAVLKEGRFMPTQKGFALQNQLVHLLTDSI